MVKVRLVAVLFVALGGVVGMVRGQLGAGVGGGVGAGGGGGLGPVTVQGPVSIQLPTGWQVIMNGGAGGDGRTLIVALSPAADRDLAGQFQATMTITVDPANVLDAAKQQDQVARTFKNYVPMERPTQITVNGQQGVMFGGTFINGTVSLRSRQFMFLKNNELLVITFTSLNSKWVAYEGLVNGSVGTLQVRNVVGGAGVNPGGGTGATNPAGPGSLPTRPAGPRGVAPAGGGTMPAGSQPASRPGGRGGAGGLGGAGGAGTGASSQPGTKPSATGR